MEDEMYTCEGCAVAYSIDPAVPVDEYPEIFKFIDISVKQKRTRVCCRDGMAKVLKSFPGEAVDYKDLKIWAQDNHGNVGIIRRFFAETIFKWRMADYNRCVANKRFAELEKKHEELELKLNVLMDMKRLGDIDDAVDRKLGKRKRHSSVY
jgi:hypothetical protein